MMWFLKGIKKRIKTENLNDKYKIKYPSVLEGKSDYNCPTGAIENNKWVKEKCIFCEKCDLKPTYKQDMYNINNNIPNIFKKSFYLYPIDSGTCGACNTEFNTIFSPIMPPETEHAPKPINNFGSGIASYAFSITLSIFSV